MNMTTVPSNQLKAMQHEIAALKEQVTHLKSSVQHEADCVDSAAAEINRQAAENDKLKETIAQQADRIVELNKECNSHYETCQQQAEAIRLKDAALDWCIGEFNLRLDDIDLSQETISVLSARHIQPSPDILQARDERVAEACAKVCIEQSEGIARSTPVSRDRVHTMFKGIARPAPVRDCSESSVRESAFRIRNGAWERHF